MSYSVSIVTDLEQVVKSIRAFLPQVKVGPMRLWGESWGRPGEDGHVLIGYEALGDCLRLQFSRDEVLAIWNPRDAVVTQERIRIGSADAMRFTYYYGDRARMPENIRYRDYALQDGLIVFRTNEDRVPGSGWMPETTATSFPAVDLGY